MNYSLEGKVAFITGAARGQGRSHAVTLAEAGATIVAVDICEQMDSVPYPMATPDQLAETAELVEKAGSQVLALPADVRHQEALDEVVGRARSEFGSIDIVSANAGIISFGATAELTETQWHDVIDVNMNGVWRTAKAAIPHMIEGGRGGSIVITSSTAGIKGHPGIAHYSTAKHGVVGLMRSLAKELAPHRIRVNSIHPCSVDTEMIQNDAMYSLFRPELAAPTRADFAEKATESQILDIPWVEPVDISNALLFLVADTGRYITGVSLPVDGGLTQR